MSNSNDKAKEKLKEYEDFISKENFELNPNFTVKVMQAVEKEKQPGFFRRLYMNLIINKKVVASVSVLCICFLFAFNLMKNELTGYYSVDDRIQNFDSHEPTVNAGASRVDYSSPKNVVKKEKSQVVGNKAYIRPAQLSDGVLMESEAGVPAEGFSYGGSSAKKPTARRRPQVLAGAEPQPLDFYRQGSKGGDKLIGYQEQGRILTSENTTSTFSIDVDTGSYTFSRKMLALGQRPNKDAVRIEEFLNYFDYDYPKQNKEPFSLYYEIAPAAFDKGRHLLMLGLNTKEASIERKPWNLTFLIDTSGSMSGADRLGLVKRSLSFLVKNMQGDDRVSIVTYAGSAGVLLEGTGIDNKQKILDAIETLGSGGSTHGSAGIHLAYQTNKKSNVSNGVNRVVIATDGDFNVGVQSHDALMKLIEEKRKSGISLSAIGVGSGNYNDAMLEQIANKGNGNYFYIDSFTEARNVFGINLAGNMEIVAKDVKVQIEFNPEHVLQYRLIGYDNRKLNNEDFANDKIDAGEIGVGHRVTAIYEVVFKDSEIANVVKGNQRYAKIETKEANKHINELAFLKLRYKEPKESVSKLINFPLLVSKRQNSLSSTSKDFRFASSVYYFASLLKDSKYAPEVKIADIVKLAKDAHKDKANRKELIEMMKNL